MKYDMKEVRERKEWSKQTQKEMKYHRRKDLIQMEREKE